MLTNIAEALGKLGNIIAETLFPISMFCHDFSVVIPTFPQSFLVFQRLHSLQLHIVNVIDNVCEEISLQEIFYIVLNRYKISYIWYVFIQCVPEKMSLRKYVHIKQVADNVGWPLCSYQPLSFRYDGEIKFLFIVPKCSNAKTSK